MKKLFYTLIAAFLTASFLTGTTAAAPEDEALSAAEQAADSEEKSDAPIMVCLLYTSPSPRDTR